MSESRADNSAGNDPLADWTDASDAAEGEESQGQSGRAAAGEALGGADAVPETPDNVPADQHLDIRDTDAGAPLTEDGYGGSSTSDG